MSERWVEKPPHVDERRMRHIDDQELFTALELDRPGLEQVAAAAEGQDWQAAGSAWQRYFATRGAPAPHLNIPGWAQAVRDTPTAAATIARAEEALAREVNFTDRQLGRSGLYGFHYLGWMAPLVYAYVLTGDQRFITGWARIFDQWFATRDEVRGDWPGLDVIWYSLGIAARSSVILHALYTFRASPALPLHTRLNMLRTLLGGARWLAEEHDSFRFGNWQFAASGELLQLAGVLPEFKEAVTWAEIARTRLLEHLELDFYPDGGHHERCPSYHTMCLSVLRKAAVIAEQCFGWRLSEHQRFPALFDWLLQLTTGAGWAPPFNDSHLVWSGTFLLWGHYFLERPEYKGIVRRVMTPQDIRAELGWLFSRPGHGDPQAVFEAAPEAAPDGGGQLLKHSQFAVLRAGWGHDDLYAAISYGPVISHELESHSHLATLDFVLAGWGCPLAWEAGGPATYDDPLYYEWYRATRAHNTVVVRGRPANEAREEAELHHVALLAPVQVFSACHTERDGVAHQRSLLFVRGEGADPPYWFVHDHLSGYVGTAEWILHGCSPWQELDGNVFRSAVAPGLVVLPANSAQIAGVSLSSGPTSLPDAAEGTSRRGELATLCYELAGDEFAAVLLPFSAEPDQAVLTVDQDYYTLRFERLCDHLGRQFWIRERDGRFVAAAAWGLDELVYGGRTLVEGRSLRAFALHWNEAGIEAELESSRATRCILLAPGARRLWLNGVLLSLVFDGEHLVLKLPWAGRFQLRVELEEHL